MIKRREKGWKFGPVYVTLSFSVYSINYGFGISMSGGYINCAPFYLDVDILPKKRLAQTEELYRQLGLNYED